MLTSSGKLVVNIWNGLLIKYGALKAFKNILMKMPEVLPLDLWYCLLGWFALVFKWMLYLVTSFEVMLNVCVQNSRWEYTKHICKQSNLTRILCRKYVLLGPANLISKGSLHSRSCFLFPYNSHGIWFLYSLFTVWVLDALDEMVYLGL